MRFAAFQQERAGGMDLGRRLAKWVAYGCFALSAAAGAQPTFSRDVLPVLQRRCQTCHRPGQAGPMSFLTYESTRPWAKAKGRGVAKKDAAVVCRSQRR